MPVGGNGSKWLRVHFHFDKAYVRTLPIAIWYPSQCKSGLQILTLSLNSLSMQYGQQKFQWNLASTMFLWILTFLQGLTITIERLTYNVFLYLKQIFFWPWNNIGQISKIQIKKEYDICKVWHKTLNIFGMDTDKHVAPPLYHLVTDFQQINYREEWSFL